jgi:23S rRNA pseudouridine1911/1915/1917 synthase
VAGGEAVRLEADFATDERLVPEAIPLDIVFSDPALAVLNKPAGLVVHPGAGNRLHTLQHALLAWDPELARVPRAGLVHRLDKDTTGLLVVARTPEVHTRLVAAMQARDIGREYLALCSGRVTAGGSIDKPIGRHRTQRTRMTVRSDGRAARTHYRVAERFAEHTLLRVQLETGRTHQIRVHLAHIAHPVVGDPEYGARRARVTRDTVPELAAALQAFQRQALHAARLEFTHPVSGAPLSFEAPLPADFARLLDALRGRTPRPRRTRVARPTR